MKYPLAVHAVTSSLSVHRERAQHYLVQLYDQKPCCRGLDLLIVGVAGLVIGDNDLDDRPGDVTLESHGIRSVRPGLLTWLIELSA
jgi:hypothetical protein